MTKNEILDSKMDMTRDMDLIKNSKGVSYWFTDLKDIPRDLFKKYVAGKSFLDIGCGDGRIIVLAMMYGAKKYHGVEMDKKFIESSNMKRHIKNCDFRDVSLDPYDCLYYFLGSTESIPPDEKGEPEFVKHVKDFEGILLIYYRKVTHRLQKFHDNLISEGFVEIDNSKYIRVYRREDGKEM